jgi:4-hydroxy-3-polyprenylbenzoate decarboxylase
LAPVIVAITGASGAIFGIRVLERLAELDVETHLVVTRWGRINIEQETEYTFAQVLGLADVTYGESEQGAAISSGSYLCAGMVIAPCSMKTLASIAHGTGQNLVCRAADVTLKERRPLILVPRETPLHSIHLRNMLTLADMGVTIAPPMPAFYNRPDSIAAMVDHLVVRVLDQLAIHADWGGRWTGLDRTIRDHD